MKDLRDKINDSLSRRKHLQQDVAELDLELVALVEEQKDLLEMQEISNKAAKLVQDELSCKLSAIVTKAIATVFEEPLEFVAQFVERRGVNEVDLFVKDAAGHTYDILSGRGGGLADVCSASLQMAFILLSDVDRYLIVDEIARHLSSEAQERFAQVLQLLCREFGFTIIMTTHSEALAEAADRRFLTSIKKGVTTVRQLETLVPVRNV